MSTLKEQAKEKRPCAKGTHQQPALEMWCRECAKEGLNPWDRKAAR